MAMMVLSTPSGPTAMLGKMSCKMGGMMFTCRYAVAALTRPVAEPTERSMLPVVMTSTMPMARKDTMVI